MVTLHAGLSLIRGAEALLERSARSFTRAAGATAPTDGAPPPPEGSSDAGAGAPSPHQAGEDLVDAVTDVLQADLLHASGTLLIRLQREQDRALLDVIA